MEDDDGVPGRVAEDGEGQAIPGDPSNPDGLGGHAGPGRGGSGEASAVAREAPQVARALDAPGPDAFAEPRPMAGRRRPDIFQFSILVPFRSSVEAVRACHFLGPRTQPHVAAVEQELIVSDSLLTIQLTAEDVNQLRISISSCIHELCLLIRNMRRTVPPFFYINPRTISGG